MHDYAEPMSLIHSLAAKLQIALADRRYEHSERLAAEIVQCAEAIQGYAQARMVRPVVKLGPEG